MIDENECRKCQYVISQMDKPAGPNAVHTRIACSKIRKEHQYGHYAFVDELIECPLEIQMVENTCLLCDKNIFTPVKRIVGLSICVCDECKNAIKRLKREYAHE